MRNPSGSKVILGLIIALTSMGNPRIAVISYNALMGKKVKEEVRGDE